MLGLAIGNFGYSGPWLAYSGPEAIHMSNTAV